MRLDVLFVSLVAAVSLAIAGSFFMPHAPRVGDAMPALHNPEPQGEVMGACNGVPGILTLYDFLNKPGEHAITIVEADGKILEAYFNDKSKDVLVYVSDDGKKISRIYHADKDTANPCTELYPESQ